MKKTLNWVNNNKHILKNFFRLQWKRTRFSEIQNNPPPHATNSLRINSRNVNSLILSLFFFLFSFFTVFYAFSRLPSISESKFIFDFDSTTVYTWSIAFFCFCFRCNFFLFISLLCISTTKKVYWMNIQNLWHHILFIYRIIDLVTLLHVIWFITQNNGNSCSNL